MTKKFSMTFWTSGGSRNGNIVWWRSPDSWPCLKKIAVLGCWWLCPFYSGCWFDDKIIQQHSQVPWFSHTSSRSLSLMCCRENTWPPLWGSWYSDGSLGGHSRWKQFLALGWTVVGGAQVPCHSYFASSSGSTPVVCQGLWGGARPVYPLNHHMLQSHARRRRNCLMGLGEASAVISTNNSVLEAQLRCQQGLVRPYKLKQPRVLSNAGKWVLSNLEVGLSWDADKAWCGLAN